jgi:hypothetical protein
VGDVTEGEEICSSLQVYRIPRHYQRHFGKGLGRTECEANVRRVAAEARIVQSVGKFERSSIYMLLWVVPSL